MQLVANDIKKILVRGTNWIGDAVMTTPALKRIRDSFPSAHLCLLSNRTAAGLFNSFPAIDEVIEYRRQEEGVSAFFKTLKILRERRFEAALLFQNAFEAALLTRLAGIPIRIGYAEQGRGILLTNSLRRGPGHRNRHQIHDYLDLVAEFERLCLADGNTRINEVPLPFLVAGPAETASCASLIQSYGIDWNSGPLVICNPGATNSRAKCWPEEHYAALSDRLIGELKARVILIGGPSELDYAERVIWRMKLPGAINLAGKTSLTQLIGLLDHCDLLISNDTGPAHIASALGAPTLTIFGPTNEFETAPSGNEAKIIRAEGIECARCMLRDCPIDHRCMTRITPDEIFEMAKQILK